jgi:hypothetical protein
MEWWMLDFQVNGMDAVGEPLLTKNSVSFFAIEMVRKEARISASKRTVRAGMICAFASTQIVWFPQLLMVNHQVNKKVL